MKTKLSIFLFFLLSSNVLLVSAQSSLSLTVTTDKQIYSGSSPVTVSGNLQHNSNSVNNALVGLEIRDPTGDVVVTRVVKTGSPPSSLQAQITSAYLSDSAGNHQSTIQAGKLAYFTFEFVNNGEPGQSVLITINLYDSSGMPIAVIRGEPTRSGRAILSIQVPSWAHSGVAHGFANIYSGWPRMGGVPLALEQSFEFSISNGVTESGGVSSVASNQGSYSLLFNLSPRAEMGVYAVFASSSYSGTVALKNTTFINQLAHPGDFNNDKAVNFKDFLIFVTAYIQFNDNLGYNQICDLDSDKRITNNDFLMFSQNFGLSWR
jgi:hypothetical protein